QGRRRTRAEAGVDGGGQGRRQARGRSGGDAQAQARSRKGGRRRRSLADVRCPRQQISRRAGSYFVPRQRARERQLELARPARASGGADAGSEVERRAARLAAGGEVREPVASAAGHPTSAASGARVVVGASATCIVGASATCIVGASATCVVDW